VNIRDEFFDTSDTTEKHQFKQSLWDTYTKDVFEDYDTRKRYLVCCLKWVVEEAFKLILKHPPKAGIGSLFQTTRALTPLGESLTTLPKKSEKAGFGNAEKLDYYTSLIRVLSHMISDETDFLNTHREPAEIMITFDSWNAGVNMMVPVKLNSIYEGFHSTYTFKGDYTSMGINTSKDVSADDYIFKGIRCPLDFWVYMDKTIQAFIQHYHIDQPEETNLKAKLGNLNSKSSNGLTKAFIINSFNAEPKKAEMESNSAHKVTPEQTSIESPPENNSESKEESLSERASLPEKWTIDEFTIRELGQLYFPGKYVSRSDEKHGHALGRDNPGFVKRLHPGRESRYVLNENHDKYKVLKEKAKKLVENRETASVS